MKRARVLVTLAVPFLLFGCHGEELSVPDHLVGIWSTAEPRFAGRYLQFTRDSIVFQTGAEQVNVHRIEKLQEEKGGKGGKTIAYVLIYREADGTNGKLIFSYDPKNQGEIRLKNQKTVSWIRESPSGEVSAG